MTDTEKSFSMVEMNLSFNLPEKPSHVSQIQFETGLVTGVLDSIIDRIVLKFIDNHHFDAKIVAGCLLNTLTNSLAYNAILLGITKESILDGVNNAYVYHEMNEALEHDAGNA